MCDQNSIQTPPNPTFQKSPQPFNGQTNLAVANLERTSTSRRFDKTTMAVVSNAKCIAMQRKASWKAHLHGLRTIVDGGLYNDYTVVDDRPHSFVHGNSGLHRSRSARQIDKIMWRHWPAVAIDKTNQRYME